MFTIIAGIIAFLVVFGLPILVLVVLTTLCIAAFAGIFVSENGFDFLQCLGGLLEASAAILWYKFFLYDVIPFEATLPHIVVGTLFWAGSMFIVQIVRAFIVLRVFTGILMWGFLLIGP